MIVSKVLGGALAGALLLSGGLTIKLAFTSHELKNAKEVISNLVEWQDGIVDTTRLASGSNEITAKTAQAQIQQLGYIRIELKNSVEIQNDAIEQLERESQLAQALVARASQQKQAAIQRADQLEKQLRNRAGVPAANMEQAVRQTQDEIYEAGL